MHYLYQLIRRFFLKDPFHFEPELASKAYMRMHWIKEHEHICAQLAATLADIAQMEKLDPTETVNEREAPSQINGKPMLMKVTAKEALEIDLKNKEVFEGKKATLEELLTQC